MGASASGRWILIASPGAEEQLADEAALWARYAKDGDPAIREELVSRYLPFARSLCQRYRRSPEPFDDLVQVASLGLVNAINRFDPSRGIPFTAFASPTILGELKRYFRDRIWTVRVPRGLHDRIAEVDRAISELTRILQRSPSVAEIAERLELEQTDVLEVLEANETRRPLSLDLRPGSEDGDESSQEEWVGDEDAGFELVEERVSLEEALPGLDDRDREVLRLRFAEDLTQTEIAERIGCSQMQVSRILRRTLDELRRRVEGGVGAG